MTLNIVPNSILAELLECMPEERTALLNNSEDLQLVYERAALQSTTEVPDPDDEVDYHYICFATSHNGRVYEMDGDLSGPVETDVTLEDNEDLSAKGLKLVKATTERDSKTSLGFSVLALSLE
jgi:ubiquitin carboxyl-terminal hydrolase L3